jgi:acylaminoacyl-peptidase
MNMIPSIGKSLIDRSCLPQVRPIQIPFVTLTHGFAAKEALDDLTPSIIPITARGPTESLLIQSKKASASGSPKPVCVTIPHGGPHTTSTTAFTPSVVALALQGCTSLDPTITLDCSQHRRHPQPPQLHRLHGIRPNAYRKAPRSIDVEDVAESVRELVRRGVAEDGRQAVLGGSHGGFIAAHRMSLSSNLAFSFTLDARV